MTPTVPDPAPPERPPRVAGISFILITVFLDVLSIGIIIPVLPELVKEFAGGDTSAAGWYVGIIAASYALMQFLFAPILGGLSDQYGRRPILLIAMFGLGVDFLVQAFAPNLGWLFAGRIFAGIMGASFSTANAYVADVSTPSVRARNYGLMGMMFGLGFIFGPACGGLLAAISDQFWIGLGLPVGEGFHLRVPFFVAAGLSLCNWLYGYFVLPESLPMESRNRFAWSKVNPLKTVYRLRDYPAVAGLAVVFLFSSLAQRGLENVWVLYTGYRFGWNELDNGLTLGLVGLMAAIVQGGLVAPIISHLGERRALVVGLLISTTAFVGYGLVPSGWMVWPIIVFGAFGGVTGPAIQSMIAATVPSSDQGKVQGSLTSLVSLTSIVAPALFTAGLFSYFTSADAPFSLPGAPLLVGAGLLLVACGVAIFQFRGRSAGPQTKSLQASGRT